MICKMRVLAVCLLLALFGVWGCVETAKAQEEIVRLTLTERLGAERTGEVVITGVPLPAGLIEDAGELALADANGQPIPADIRPVIHWPDGSVKWVHLYFSADCGAKGTTEVSLVRGLRTRPEGLTVEDGAETITVTTGSARFIVRKTGFNLIDQAWIDPEGQGRFDDANQLIAPHQGGLLVASDDNDYWAHQDDEAEVEIEEQGPMHVVIRAEGAHRNADGDKMMDFIVRIYAYANSPMVRVVHTALNRQGERSDSIPVQAMHVELPTQLGAGQVRIDDQVQTALGDEQPEAHAYAFRTSTTGRAMNYSPGKQEDIEPGNNVSRMEALKGQLSWGREGGPGGMAAGIRWFWQMHPKSIEANRDGTLTFGLVPRRHEEPVLFYTGVARTHDLMLALLGPGGSEKADGHFAALEQPLRAFAPTRWYCRDTRAFGDLAEADEALYEEQYRDAMNKYDADFQRSYQNCIENTNSRTRNRNTHDSYGLLTWGDGYHWSLRRGDTRPINLMWNGNYYGFPHMMGMQWARTGHPGYFRMFKTHARHVADVHLVHYDPNPQWIGANRYCPPPEHVRIHRSSDPDQNPVYVSNTFNHHKAESFFENWYLLADHRMLDAIAEVGGYIMRYRNADRDRSQPRGPGNLMMTLAQLCEFHGYADEWMNRYRQAFEANLPHRPRFTFQLGFWLEGVLRYYETTGDERALDRIRTYCDEIMEDNEHTDARRAIAFAFLYAQTGEEKYRDFAAASVQRTSPQRWKDFGSLFRSGMFVSFWLTEEGAREAGRAND